MKKLLSIIVAMFLGGICYATMLKEIEFGFIAALAWILLLFFLFLRRGRFFFLSRIIVRGDLLFIPAGLFFGLSFSTSDVFLFNGISIIWILSMLLLYNRVSTVKRIGQLPLPRGYSLERLGGPFWGGDYIIRFKNNDEEYENGYYLVLPNNILSKTFWCYEYNEIERSIFCDKAYSFR